MDTLDERLNRILPTLTSEKFRENRGLGNEVPFYAFDYPAQAEPRVREHIDFLVGHLNKVSPPIRVARVHLFEVLMSMLDERDFYSKAC